MKRSVMGMLGLASAFTIGLGAGLVVDPPPRAWAQADRSAGDGRYTVIDTEATNLLVTDNHTNTLYFYTVDRDEPPGADLKLRGSVDLARVGQPVIKPSLYKQ